MTIHKPLDVLTPEEQKAIHIYLQKIEKELGDQLKQTILFGSKAREDGDADSDIDILIVVEDASWPIRNAISDIGSGISLEYGILVGPFVIAQERWEMMKRERFSLYENVARDGIPLPLGTD